MVLFACALIIIEECSRGAMFNWAVVNTFAVLEVNNHITGAFDVTIVILGITFAFTSIFVQNSTLGALFVTLVVVISASANFFIQVGSWGTDSDFTLFLIVRVVVVILTFANINNEIRARGAVMDIATRIEIRFEIIISAPTN